MKSQPLYGDDNQPDSVYRFIFQNALGKAIQLDQDDTTALGLVPDGEIGINPTNGKIFTRFNGTTYLIATMTAV